MPIRVAQYSGFCVGVRNALETARRAAEAAREKQIGAYCLGELIHNRFAVEELERAGVRTVESIDGIPEGQAVILRSHGVPPETLEECQRRKLTVFDCTCSYVAALHRIVQKAAQEDMPVILVGEMGHPEISATAGWCFKSLREGNRERRVPGRCVIVSSVQDAERIPDMPRALAVAQTTLPLDTWERVTEALERRVGALVRERTICGATARRQAEAMKLAGECDCMIVVGSRTSANTRRLYETCAGICPRTCLAESAADIPPGFCDIRKDSIGLAAGASTPDWLLKEVVTRMNDTEKDILENVQEAKEAAQEAVGEVKEAAETAQEAVTETAEAAQEAVEAVKEEAAEAEKPALTEEEQRKQDFLADVEKSFVRIHNGQTLTGKVVQTTDDEVFVSLGYKSDGILKRDDLVDKDAKPGDEIEVEVVKVNDGEGNVILSQRNIINRKVWDALVEKFEKGEYVEAVGKEAVKGGLIATCDGVRAFVPASRLALHYVEKIGQFVGQTMKLKIIDVDRQKKRIVASRKDVLIEESAAKKAAAWEKLEEGAVVKGIVRRFADFGAFVDLGGVDGLIHVTDLSWGRVNKPSDILSTNQEVEVKILSLDPERERIQLGYKQLQPKPWDNIEEKYPVGIVLERPVVRIRTFGAFVELEPGVDGLVHISQCALTRVGKVEDVLSVGQMVRVKVLNVDPEAKRISLSIREVLADEAMEAPMVDDIPGEIEEAPAEEAAEAPAEEAQE